jgi:FtsZ-interacting cell division protein ZipA
MDATALRWVLAIIGIVIIAGVYLYTVHQQKLRRRAAIKTFTHEELETGIIEDEMLSRELSSINSMLEDELKEKDLKKIKINPALDSEQKHSLHVKSEASAKVKQKEAKITLQLPRLLDEIEQEKLVVHVLKAADDRIMTGSDLINAFKHAELEINEMGHAEFAQNPVAEYRFANITMDGSFNSIADAQFNSYGMVCFYDLSAVQLPLTCYELMLKKIDELVRMLDLNVYDRDLNLLTLKHITDMRDMLKVHES